MLRLITFLKPYAPYMLAAWIIIIFIVSSIPRLPTLRLHTSGSDIRLDYLMHFCEYGLLTFLAFLSFIKKEFKTETGKVFVILTGLVLFALADEFHQKLIPGRTFNPKDIAGNIAGIVAGLVFCVVTFRMIVNKRK